MLNDKKTQSGTNQFDFLCLKKKKKVGQQITHEGAHCDGQETASTSFDNVVDDCRSKNM